MARDNPKTILAAATTLLVALVLASLALGEYNLAPALAKLARGEPVPETALVALKIRLARTLTAVIVGATLAAAGAAIQSVMRNPLASPFTLGVSQAAAFGAATTIIVLGSTSQSLAATPIARYPYLLPLAAFASSLAAMAAVYIVGSARGMSPYAVVLAGVGVGFLFQALTMLVEYLAPNEVLVASALFWMFGDVSRTTLDQSLLIGAAVAPVLAYFILCWMRFNALLLGDETAASIGVKPERFRLETIVLASLATAVAVAFVGVIGFIGLIAPHIARLAVGRDYRYLMPLSIVTGASLLLAADTLGRTLLAPTVLPVGITTSLIGAPLLVALLTRR